MTILNELSQNKIIDIPKWMLTNLLFLTRSGSYFYGMNVNNSDNDLIGVTMPLKSMIMPQLNGQIFGFDQLEAFNSYQAHGKVYKNQEYDVTIYSLINFFKLAKENNPNILELLFAPTDCVLFNTPIMQRVIDHRQLFVSKEVFHKFRGYAFSNWHKIKSKEPEGKRKQLIYQYGFDTKYASHTFRLIYGCKQILLGEELNYRLFKDELLDIRNGTYSLDYLDSKLDGLKTELEKLYQTSIIQEKPNHEKIRNLLWSCLEMHYENIRSFNYANEDLLNELKDLVQKYEK